MCKKSLFFLQSSVFLALSVSISYAHLCDNVFRQADKLIVKPENYNMVVKDKATFKIFLQNNMDRGIAEISLLIDSPAFYFQVTPEKMSIPKDQRAYFQVTMAPKPNTKTGNYPISFRLVGGGRQFKSFNLNIASAHETQKTEPEKNTSRVLKVSRAISAPLLDGNLEDPCWKTAAILSNFSSLAGEEAMYQTAVLLTFDNAHLYFGIYSYFDKSEGVSEKDTIKILLTKDASRYPYYSFLFPVIGNPTFKKFSSDKNAVFLDSDILGYRVKENDGFWSLEMALSLPALNFQPLVSPEHWYIRIIRNKGGNNPETSFWAMDSSGYNNEKGDGELLFVP